MCVSMEARPRHRTSWYVCHCWKSAAPESRCHHFCLAMGTTMYFLLLKLVESEGARSWWVLFVTFIFVLASCKDGWWVKGDILPLVKISFSPVINLSYSVTLPHPYLSTSCLLPAKDFKRNLRPVGKRLHWLMAIHKKLFVLYLEKGNKSSNVWTYTFM